MLITCVVVCLVQSRLVQIWWFNWGNTVVQFRTNDPRLDHCYRSMFSDVSMCCCKI